MLGINSKGDVADLDNLEARFEVIHWQHPGEGGKARLGRFLLLIFRVSKGVHFGWENFFDGKVAGEMVPSVTEKVSASEFDAYGVVASESDASDFEFLGLLISFSTSSFGI